MAPPDLPPVSLQLCAQEADFSGLLLTLSCPLSVVGFGQWKAPVGQWSIGPGPFFAEYCGWKYPFLKALSQL